MARGARHFVFLGRSGCDKLEAKSLVSRLRYAGAAVTVIRGDVTKRLDVKGSAEACNTLGKSIGGVVQAAMGLHEALFSRSIQPKWAGTWNLHAELEGHDLDFFLLTSSVSGSVGTATESNYCAANAFLDAFSPWQRQRGIPSVSVGLGMISEVGYLHENPNIEALLLRKGIQPLSEDEFLHVIDLALSSITRVSNDYTSAHILTGLEPFGLRKLMHGQRNAARRTQTGLGTGASIPIWLRSIPAHIAEFFSAVDHNKSLAQFGMDSMIASEFRTWFWRSFKVDVAFIDLLSPSVNLDTLAKLVETNIANSTNEDRKAKEAN
ncbi:KR domain-containing protein [Jackrogersella minutella]|nr:KR domain-containing protein [Jackrogersella minutella]